MKILILGAAGQIGRLLTTQLLEQTDANLVLYARSASNRLKVSEASQEQIVEGDFNDAEQLVKAMKGIDIIYINDMGNPASTRSIVQAMNTAGVKRVIAASILGIYDEVPGPFGKWNKRMVGSRGIQQQADSAKILEDSGLDYTLLRLTWLYNEADNTSYMLTDKGKPFIGAQVTRQAVTRLIVDIINDTSNHFIRKSIGVSEPDTDWDKPSFY